MRVELCGGYCTMRGGVMRWILYYEGGVMWWILYYEGWSYEVDTVL